MTLNEYQARARAYATGGGSLLEYAVLGLAEEAGEAAGKVAKFIRRHNCSASVIRHDEKDAHALALELGDCLWMVANACSCLGMGLDEVAAMNIEKLAGRKLRGTICGEGDER